ncbi:3-beta hydroxysteroid dehydrogenase/isomerasefamily protein [Striga asiatica]|uniref:3-beta hydroxysteroid dehydrogenase/isomerasefamily protein n=1 Tax=Striga asiatica TaxID=4170 RepID=A0A5A7P251_STRAF|nr:3-beta hydroxysteroid dehydrogenase/isomerasefamily protein [Striga asiatica]
MRYKQTHPVSTKAGGPVRQRIEEWEEGAELALRDYNKKHGTDLELVRVLEGNVWATWTLGVGVDFTLIRGLWKHSNFVARWKKVGSSNKKHKKPLVFFAESYHDNREFKHTKLSLVEPSYYSGDKFVEGSNINHGYGCTCASCIWCPRPGFRAGFYPVKKACESIILSEQDATGFAEFAIQDYNEKHGINLKLERALECNRFECSGLLMDFTKKKTTWVHMNLVASVGPKEELHVLFAEFYLSDVADDEYVLATLALVDTSWDYCVSKRDGLCCRFCPDDIRHPMKGRFCLLEEDEPFGF